MKKTSVIILSFMIIFLQLLNCTGAKNENNMFRANLKHTGVYKTKPVEKFNGIKWKFKTDDEIHSSPVISGRTLYFGSDDGNFYAINIKDGSEKWRFTTDHKIRSSPAICKGVVYFHSWDNYLYALNAKNGEEMWRFKAYDGGWASPTIIGDMIYFGSSLTVYAINIKSGQEVWNFNIAKGYSGGMSTPAFAHGIVYIGNWEGDFYALDCKTGKEIWYFKTGSPKVYAAGGEELVSSPAILDSMEYPQLWDWEEMEDIKLHSIIFFGSWDGNLYFVEGKTGKNLGTFPTSGKISSSPAISEGVIFIGSDDGYLYAFKIGSGFLWKFKTDDPIRSSPAVVNGLVYFGSLDGYLYSVDIKTGKEKWKFKTDDGIYSSPVVSDGVIYFGSTDGYLYALH